MKTSMGNGTAAINRCHLATVPLKTMGVACMGWCLSLHSNGSESCFITKTLLAFGLTNVHREQQPQPLCADTLLQR